MRHCEPVATIIRCHPLARIMEEILPNGTYTLEANTLKPVQIELGYYVGLHEGTYLKMSRPPTKEVVKLYAKLFKQQYASYVGVWTDENGDTHIDPSVWLRHLEDALLTAEKNNQLAIWDIKNMVSIYLD